MRLLWRRHCIELLVLALLLALVIGLIARAGAQAPASCEDQARVLRALVDQYARAEAQQKLEAAREIAELRKALEEARAATTTKKGGG